MKITRGATMDTNNPLVHLAAEQKGMSNVDPFEDIEKKGHQHSTRNILGSKISWRQYHYRRASKFNSMKI